MAERRDDSRTIAPAADGETVVVRRIAGGPDRGADRASGCSCSCCSSLVALVWIERRPIATDSSAAASSSAAGSTPATRSTASAFAPSRSATSSSAIRANPDLTARYARSRCGSSWNGSVRSLSDRRARRPAAGRLVDGKVSWGQIDKLLPPPSDKPFKLPDFALDIADSRIALDDAVRAGRDRARRATAI